MLKMLNKHMDAEEKRRKDRKLLRQLLSTRLALVGRQVEVRPMGEDLEVGLHLW